MLSFKALYNSNFILGENIFISQKVFFICVELLLLQPVPLERI